MPEFIEQDFKTLLNKKKFIDSWFWDRYTINPYNGCAFGCIYCDARSAKYHMPADFENKIIVKKHVGDILEQRLARARTLLPDVVGLGGVTDCYQGAEREFRNTRRILEVLAKYAFPAHIITKSTLVLKDLSLLNEIGKTAWCTVSVTITTTDEKTARFLDKRSPAPRLRFDVIRRIKQVSPDVQTGVLLIPLIPMLCDSDTELENTVAMAKKSGADYLLFGGGMTMRDQQAVWFLSHLRRSFPELIPKYEELYRFTDTPDSYDGAYTPRPDYVLAKQRRLLELCEHYGIRYRIPRFIPEDFRKVNYRLAEMLLNEAYRRQILGKYWQNHFWAGQNIQNLQEAIESVAARNELSSIRNIGGKIKTQVEEHLKSI